jgi:hypothetical protein
MTHRVLFGLIIMIATASGATARGKYVYGAGTISCAEWLNYRSTGGDPNSYQVQAWVDGFLSAHNLADDEQGDFLLSAPKAVASYAWIDNYCGPKPLDQVIQAVIALKKELQSRSQNGKK